jgi:hypothetical protein
MDSTYLCLQRYSGERSEYSIEVPSSVKITACEAAIRVRAQTSSDRFFTHSRGDTSPYMVSVRIFSMTATRVAVTCSESIALTVYTRPIKLSASCQVGRPQLYGLAPSTTGQPGCFNAGRRTTKSQPTLFRPLLCCRSFRAADAGISIRTSDEHWTRRVWLDCLALPVLLGLTATQCLSYKTWYTNNRPLAHSPHHIYLTHPICFHAVLLLPTPILSHA